MGQKLVIALLLALIIGAVGIGIASVIPSNTDTTTDTNVVAVNANTNGNQNLNANPDATPNADTNVPDTAGTPQQIQQVQAQNTVGDVWNGEGTIASMDDFGMTVNFSNGTSAYVELGPPAYWKEQGLTLAEGDMVQVAGWNNGEQIHARLVTTANGAMELRTEASQPLWSGGASNTNGQGQAGTHDSTQELTFQVAAEDWLTISGTVTIVTNGTVTMQTDDGTVFALQMGQPNFWQSQGVTLAVGDAIEVLGFWQSGQFMVGDITKASTGEHIILRDPNGRQLWGGPGRNGNANGNTTTAGN